MRKTLLFSLSLIILAGCNSMYIKPGTLDPTQPIYSVAGGFGMKRSIKERMEERGYNVRIGKQTVSRTFGDMGGDGSVSMNEYKMENVRYVVNVMERKESVGPKMWFLPQYYWCMFNGFWWWDFNVSIGDQQTGEEIFTWRGVGCQNSSLRKLDRALDELEMKQSDDPRPWNHRVRSVKPG